MKERFIAIVVLVFSFFKAGYAQKVEGQLVHFEAMYSRYVQPRNVDVWLPADYDRHKKYAVLYMHDGQSLFDTGHSFNHSEWEVDETLSRLLSKKKIISCIVVGIWNTGMTRKAEYFPQKALDYLSEKDQQVAMAMLEGGPKADDYLKFIVRELKPMVDSQFSTFRDPAHTFIAGSSMGGLISIYGICEYPDVFGGAACLSTHWTGNYQAKDNPIPVAIAQYLDRYLPQPKGHKIYFDYGSLTLDSLYKPYQQQVDQLMIRHGYTSANWITREFIGEGHNEEAWSRRFYIPARFLLGAAGKRVSTAVEGREVQ